MELQHHIDCPFSRNLNFVITHTFYFTCNSFEDVSSFWITLLFMMSFELLKLLIRYKYCGAHQNCYFVAHLCVFLSFSSNREICGHNVYKCHQPIDCASHELTHYYFTLLKKVSGTKFLPKLGFQQQIRQF